MIEHILLIIFGKADSRIWTSSVLTHYVTLLSQYFDNEGSAIPIKLVNRIELIFNLLPYLSWSLSKMQSQRRHKMAKRIFYENGMETQNKQEKKRIII